MGTVVSRKFRHSPISQKVQGNTADFPLSGFCLQVFLQTRRPLGPVVFGKNSSRLFHGHNAALQGLGINPDPPTFQSLIWRSTNRTMALSHAAYYISNGYIVVA